MRTALSIAGSDPTGGAGLQADLQVFRAFGVHGAAAPSALTIQDGRRVLQALPVFPSVMLEQLRRLFDALRPDAVKLGMLGSDDVLRMVSLALDQLAPNPPPLVIDPVLFASDGTPLLEARARDGLRQLCQRATLLTPNHPEAAELSGCEIESKRDVEAAARTLLKELGARAVLLTGGHAEGDADDCLVQQAGQRVETRWFEGARIKGEPAHGTGCALAAAITAGLAQGAELETAIATARTFVRHAIASAFTLENGARLLNFGAGDDAGEARAADS